MTRLPADLDRLEQLAREATPGPWRGREDDRDADGLWLVETDHGVPDDIALYVEEVDAHLIAALDPATVSELVAAARLGAAGPAPNVAECTCDRDDDSWVGEPVDMPLCPYHEKRLRHLSWESLASMVIDYEAAIAERGMERRP